MGRRDQKRTKLLLILLLSGILCMITACSPPTSVTHADADMISDLEEWLSEELQMDVHFSSWRVYTAADGEALPEADAYFDVIFPLGDVCFERIYALKYSYSRAFGWDLQEVLPALEDQWSVSNITPVDEDRIIQDLEGAPYFSGYSNGQLEARRVLSSSILNRECDAAVGYDRINLQVVLNADDVHEVVQIDCEYLLDESYCWKLFAQETYLDTVNVQSGVSDETLLEGIKSLKFYRDEEESTWSIGELDRLTYDILSRDLDSEASEELIEVRFRGEGTYMYITGTVLLDFRFSSGWYLYDTTLEEDTCETGMLIDSWVLGERQLLDTILLDRPFTYDAPEDFVLTEDMLSDFEISEIRISENGRYQTAYFSYDVQVCETMFHIQGYGKYELTDGGQLVMNTWNDAVDDISYDLTGVWYAQDLTEDYLAYYTLKLTDPGNGTLEGQLNIYGVDLTGKTAAVFNASCSVLGNISFGTRFELFVENWNVSDDGTEILMPSGQYDIFNDMLIDENIHSNSCVFTKQQPSDRISRTELSKQLEAGDIAETLQTLLNPNKKSRSKT
jgi:hypothetical protein